MADDRLDEIEAEIKHHPDPVVSASDVVDAIEDDVGRRTVLNDMRVLERAGALESKEVGARAVAWWHVDRTTPAPPRDPADDDQRALEETVDDAGGPPDRDVGADVQQESVDGVVASLDLPGSGSTLDARRDAVRACYEFVREHGQGQRSEFLENVYPDKPARFGSERGWWNAIGKQGLRELADRTGAIDPPGEGEHVWYWTG